jgi:hypothetical protein
MPTERDDRPKRPAYPWGVAALVIVLLLSAGIWASTTQGSEGVLAGPADAGEAPSPLFDEVEQLVPTTLPDGWSRCGGGPSERPEAGDDWWAQSFGPVDDGGCRPVIVVTQIPPDAQADLPETTEDGKVGGEDDDPDAIRWSDASAGSLGLYTWARGQGLLVEGCCGTQAMEHFDALAVAALEGTRERTLPRCPKPESDLDQESEVDNYFGSRARMYDRDDCPLRRDVATMDTNDADHHCWPNLTTLVIGTPLGATYAEGTGRVYARDPDNTLYNPALDFDRDADLPPSAHDTGYHREDRSLWIDEADEERVYIVYDDGHVESWPRDRKPRVCA